MMRMPMGPVTQFHWNPECCDMTGGWHQGPCAFSGGLAYAEIPVEGVE